MYLNRSTFSHLVTSEQLWTPPQIASGWTSPNLNLSYNDMVNTYKCDPICAVGIYNE